MDAKELASVVGACVRRRLMEAKRRLYRDKHKADEARLEAEEACLYAQPDAAQSALGAFTLAKDAQLALDLQLRRADEFGLRYANALPPLCIVCFTERDSLLTMSDAGAAGGAQRFRCASCGLEIAV